jgi:Protein of unknown function (DUF3618)
MTSQRSAASTAAAGGTATGTAAPDPQQLTRQIERTRAQLGETVHALVAKTDVKARAVGALRRTGMHLTGAVTRAKHQAGGQIVPRASAVATKAAAVAPQRAAAKVVAVARKQPVVPLGLAAVAVAGVLIAAVRRGR